MIKTEIGCYIENSLGSQNANENTRKTVSQKWSWAVISDTMALEHEHGGTCRKLGDILISNMLCHHNIGHFISIQIFNINIISILFVYSLWDKV